MIVEIKNEFLTSLRNDTQWLQVTFFEEDGEEYVDKVFDLSDGNNIAIPPYLARKNVLKFMQTFLPTSRIKVLEDMHSEAISPSFISFAVVTSKIPVSFA